MKKNKNVLFLLPICLSVLIINFVFVSSAFASVNNITKIVFTTVPQIPAPMVGELSKIITVKAQNSSGDNQLFDDADGLLELSTNSPTGNFFTNTSATDATNTLKINNKGWSGRNFYYRDSSEGNFVITVKLSIVPDSGKSWTATQNINIGTVSTNTSDLGSDNSNLDTSIPTTTSDISNQNTQIVKTVVRTVYISSHSGEEDLSNYDEKTAFEVAAGRERMAVVGSPLGFLAKYTLLQKDVCNPTFRWSFGDGFEDRGISVTHTYKYAGEYQVVLSGDCGGYSAISRTIVKVISPNISIFSLDNGDIEIFNKDKAEINIGMWKIKGGQTDFIFPQDTIISADNKIILSKEDLKINNSIGKVSLNNPSGREVSIFDSKSLIQNIATSSQILFSSSTDVSVTVIGKTITLSKEKVVSNKVIPKNNVSNAINKSFVQTATVVEAVNSTTTRGFWANIIDIPVKSLKSFVHIFYDF